MEESNPLPGFELRSALKDQYIELISTIKSHDTYKQVAGFMPLVGSNFENSISRLLVYGRAVNGWKGSLNLTSSDAGIYEDMCQIHPEDRNFGCEMNWLKRSRLKWAANKNNGYNYKQSSFWNGISDVLMALEGSSEMAKKDWPSLLAWSNVYKISPAGTGNPNNMLRKTQIPLCELILQTEIERLQPKNILFITSDWGKNILHSVGILPDYKSKNIVLFANKMSFQWNTRLNVNVVVAVRPERQKRERWGNAVISSFRELDKNA